MARYSLEELIEMCNKYLTMGTADLQNTLIEFEKERNELRLLLFQPVGESHHDANKCPYCQSNLNGKT